MSEAHTVYKVERSAKWDQRMPATPMRSRGPVLGIREPSSRPIPYSQVIRTEQRRQAALSNDIAKTQERMLKLEDQMRDRMSQYADSSGKVQAMQSKLDKLTAEKLAAEEELRQSKASLEEAEEKIGLLQMNQSAMPNFESFENAPSVDAAPLPDSPSSPTER